MMTPADTLACDTLQIAMWRQDGAFDYDRELIAPQMSLTEWLLRQFRELVASIFGTDFALSMTEPLLIFLGTLIIGVVVWFLYKTRPGLFSRNRRTGLAYEQAEETIYGIDFEQETDAALRRKDYRAAVRMVYLQVLRSLSDRGQIDWQLYKTPTQYMYEYRREAFSELTRRFLRVRYGNFEAGEADYRAVRQLQQAIGAAAGVQEGGGR